MGNRSSVITTRPGDSGLTSLGNGTCVEKDSIHIEAIGAIDELNGALGILVAKSLLQSISVLLRQVQNSLFDMGAEISFPGRKCFSRDSIEQIDKAIAELSEGLPPSREFVLPGGTEAGALCHFARAVCRSAERRLVTLQALDPIPADFKVPYLNRLSDLLFVLARAINRSDGVPEICRESIATKARARDRQDS